MANRRPLGYLDNDCEANIDENMCKLIDAINEGGGGGGGDIVVPPAISKVELTSKANSNSRLMMTLTFDDKTSKSSYINYTDFVPYFSQVLSYYTTSNKNSWNTEAMLNSMPRYESALDYIAPVNGEYDSNLVQVTKSNKKNNGEYGVRDLYKCTQFTRAESLKILSAPTVANGVKTYSAITLTDAQAVNYYRTDEGYYDDYAHPVGIYRKEYYQFENVTCTDKTKPLCLVLTLQNGFSEMDGVHYIAPIIIKLADKVSDFDFENTMIKVQNGGGNGDFIVSLVPKVTNTVVTPLQINNDPSVVTDDLVNCYGGSVTECLQQPYAPKVICVLKNQLDDTHTGVSPVRLYVQQISLCTDLCYTADTVPADFTAYKSAITNFKINMWIEQYAERDDDFSYQNYQKFVRTRYEKLYSKWG